MELWEFIERYVFKNTILRIWGHRNNGQHKLLWDGHKEWCMEWQILNDECYQSKYKHCKIIGVTDILCDNCWEAVNLVIETSEV